MECQRNVSLELEENKKGLWTRLFSGCI